MISVSTTVVDVSGQRTNLSSTPESSATPAQSSKRKSTNKENDLPSNMLSAEKRRLEPSAFVVSKVNSILFKSDQGPASNLLGDSVDHVNHQLPYQESPQQYPPPPTDEIQFTDLAMVDYHYPRCDNHYMHQEEMEQQGISPLRSVHFDSSMQTSYVLDEEIVQLRHTAAIVAGLQKKLKQAKEDLTSERANRKRKEKNLIKLAKEMNHRHMQNEVTDKKMEEMEESIADLEQRLAEKSQALPQLELLCEQKELALLEEKARSERHLAELEQAKQDAAKARQELFDVVLTSSLSAPPLPPPPPPRIAPTMDDSGKDSLSTCIPAEAISIPNHPSPEIDVNNNITRTTKIRATASRELVATIPHVLFWGAVMMILSIVLLRSSYVHPSVLDMVCAPMPPGSYVPPPVVDRSSKNHRSVRIFQAPYWVPDPYKREVFSLLCPGRGQTVLQQQVHGKLEIFRDGTRIWKGRAGGGFRVELDKIIVLGRRQQKILREFQGPWTI